MDLQCSKCSPRPRLAPPGENRDIPPGQCLLTAGRAFGKPQHPGSHRANLHNFYGKLTALSTALSIHHLWIQPHVVPSPMLEFPFEAPYDPNDEGMMLSSRRLMEAANCMEGLRHGGWLGCSPRLRMSLSRDESLCRFRFHKLCLFNPIICRMCHAILHPINNKQGIQANRKLYKYTRSTKHKGQEDGQNDATLKIRQRRRFIGQNFGGSLQTAFINDGDPQPSKMFFVHGKPAILRDSHFCNIQSGYLILESHSRYHCLP